MPPPASASVPKSIPKKDRTIGCGWECWVAIGPPGTYKGVSGHKVKVDWRAGKGKKQEWLILGISGPGAD